MKSLNIFLLKSGNSVLCGILIWQKHFSLENREKESENDKRLGNPPCPPCLHLQPFQQNIEHLNIHSIS